MIRKLKFNLQNAHPFRGGFIDDRRVGSGRCLHHSDPYWRGGCSCAREPPQSSIEISLSTVTSKPVRQSRLLAARSPPLPRGRWFLWRGLPLDYRTHLFTAAHSSTVGRLYCQIRTLILENTFLIVEDCSSKSTLTD